MANQVNDGSREAAVTVAVGCFTDSIWLTQAKPRVSLHGLGTEAVTGVLVDVCADGHARDGEQAHPLPKQPL